MPPEWLSFLSSTNNTVSNDDFPEPPCPATSLKSWVGSPCAGSARWPCLRRIYNCSANQRWYSSSAVAEANLVEGTPSKATHDSGLVPSPTNAQDTPFKRLETITLMQRLQKTCLDIFVCK